MVDPVYILIRTSGRPNCFKKMMESIKAQTYPNIVTITHSDDIKDNAYIEGDIIIRSKRNPALGRGFYNLYCNALLAAIPQKKSGWYHFIDDDDYYCRPDAIEQFVKNAKITHINIARSDRGGGRVWPKTWKGQMVFQTECFFLHVSHKDKWKWWSKKAGDHGYTKQVTKKLPINWIENLIVCRAIIGKGRGKRIDINF